MTYNPEKQYRCAIIRGKAQTLLDDLLPAYAHIIASICPCSKKDFKDKFNKFLSSVSGITGEKVLDNHRTEIAGKLFGMWRIEEGIIYATEKTTFLLDKSDNPAFFKDIISKLQFPNGMDKIQTLLDRQKNKINIKPCVYVLKLLKIAQDKKQVLTKNEIAYYVLNSLNVLQGGVLPETVFLTIIERRRENIYKKVEPPEGKCYSYSMQHITEILNLMELANLIRVKNIDNHEKKVELNNKEIKVINIIIEMGFTCEFDIYKYNLHDTEEKLQMYFDWSLYYTSLSDKISDFFTTSESLFDEKSEKGIEQSQSGEFESPADIGDEGEKIVVQYEKDRVKEFNSRLVNKVIHLGKQRGLGYDVSSIKALGGDDSEHAIYIEVKTTKRVTAPGEVFADQVYLTRNEWVAAEQHKDNFYVYRVFLSNAGYNIFKMCNPVSLREKGIIYAEPLKYRVEFSNIAGKFIV